jgi:hypothetical protein
MHRGYSILKNHGQNAFDRFAQKSKMPIQDVERVQNKHLYDTDPEIRAKMDKRVAEIKRLIGLKIKL